MSLIRKIILITHERALEVETLTKFRGKIGKIDKLLYDDIEKTHTHTFTCPFYFG